MRIFACALLVLFILQITGIAPIGWGLLVFLFILFPLVRVAGLIFMVAILTSR